MIQERRFRWPLLVCFAFVVLSSCDDDDGGGNAEPTDTTTTEDSTSGTDSGDSGDSTDTTVTPPGGNGEIESLEAMGSGLDLPFDSALSPDGTEIFYVSMVDGVHQLFKIDANGQTSQLSTGAEGFVFPIGVVTDGAQVFVLDIGWIDPSAGDDATTGALFTVPVAGGTPTLVAGTEEYLPTSATISFNNGTPEMLYFTGTDPSDRAPGVFSMSVAGGAITPVTKGGSLVSPAGVAVASDGTLYVADSVGFDQRGGVFKVSPSGEVSALIDNLLLGMPAGIVVSSDNNFLLLSALNLDTRTAVVLRVDASTGELVNSYAPDNIAQNRESGGLHCAATTDRCVWADAASKASGGGTVYVVYLTSNPK